MLEPVGGIERRRSRLDGPCGVVTQELTESWRDQPSSKVECTPAVQQGGVMFSTSSLSKLDEGVEGLCAVEAVVGAVLVSYIWKGVLMEQLPVDCSVLEACQESGGR
ncbi:hypothetical protein KC353_g44 [Hortaea werneckii]|nr:hypothetical protein KC353_g44 [Hortaea werneckii]